MHTCNIYIILLYIILLYVKFDRIKKNVPNPKCQIENNTLCVYAIDFRRSTMLAYIYHGHRIAYDPILRVRKPD